MRNVDLAVCRRAWDDGRIAAPLLPVHGAAIEALRAGAGTAPETPAHEAQAPTLRVRAGSR